MADYITRKRLKKKVLDRWENEGGRIISDPVGTDEGGPKGEYGGEFTRPRGATGGPPLGAPAPPAKERQPAEE